MVPDGGFDILHGIYVYTDQVTQSELILYEASIAKLIA